MFHLLSEELLCKILDYGHIHYGPYSFWVSCGNPVKRIPLSLGKQENTFDLKRLSSLTQVNRELYNMYLPILRNIKDWYVTLNLSNYLNNNVYRLI